MLKLKIMNKTLKEKETLESLFKKIMKKENRKRNQNF